ncbi:BREX-1 system adenine-specific DNA-methyltransferase PglX [Alcaligenaceae bacterium]|nr:BREX-1 system adenine-specific DNA-methyltransferase PglX [Alcaligenaceae bacterium]
MDNENKQVVGTEQNMEKYFFRASAADFKKIPGKPIGYWIGEKTRNIFSKSDTLDKVAKIKQGLATCNNDLFLRLWFEVASSQIGYGVTSHLDALESKKKWFPYNKGGGYRKWYGNNDYLVNWKNNGEDIHAYSNLPMDYSGAPVRAKRFYFLEGITYGLISSYGFSARRVFGGFVFDVGGSMIFPEKDPNRLLGFLCSTLTKALITTINPTLNYQVGDIQKLPIMNDAFKSIKFDWDIIIKIGKTDWDTYEISWGFTTLLLLHAAHRQPTLKGTYQKLRTHWQDLVQEMHYLEEENNRIFIEAYGLQDELTPDVPLKEITLTCNPHYRYGGNKTEAELEALLLADTIREFLSYAVGCMFGRYSLDKPGLVLANQGETLADYLAQVSNPIFTPDQDNVIPMLDGEWFADDITERFRQFLRVTFGEEHYEENLTFIEDAIGKDIRRFFLRDFYNDHVKRYKKRPIYWLFSSPKGTFSALIYLHRYRPDTVSIVLGYLRDFRNKLDSHLKHLEQVSISTDAGQAEKTRALKEIDNLKKQLLELDDYEHDTLYPLATQQITIDLDDGVKANYPKFGSALKRIVGLDAKDDD